MIVERRCTYCETLSSNGIFGLALESQDPNLSQASAITSLCYLSRLYWVKDDCTLVLKQALPLS